MNKKILITILVIVLTGCVLVSALLITAGVFIVKDSGSKTTLTASATPAALGTAARTVGATQATGNNTQIPADIARQMDEIQQQVLSYRGLKQKQPLSRALLTSTQLEDKVVNDFFADYTDQEASDDSAELATLGLLPAGFDLHGFYVKLYSEQIAGYYDPKTKDMYVVSDQGFTGNDRMTYAHEFTHVLQDQNYDIRNGLKDNEDYCKKDSEYCGAVQALIEGDATLSQYYWYYNFATAQDKTDIDNFQKTYKSPVYDSAPAYMQQDFLFPYSQGLDFVSYLYKQNGWNSVDAAFSNPPVSTEQILHPEKYPKDVPVKVTLPDFTNVLGSGWRETDRNTMGEWYTYLLLRYGRDTSFQLDDQTAKDAAAGWGGDLYVYYRDDSTSQSALVWRLVWDTKKDSDEFWQASQAYGNKRWGTASSSSSNEISWNSSTDGLVTMRNDNGAILWMISPDTATQSKLMDAYQKGAN